MEYTWVLIVSKNLFCNEMSLPKKKRLEQASNQTTCVWGNMYYNVSIFSYLYESRVRVDIINVCTFVLWN